MDNLLDTFLSQYQIILLVLVRVSGIFIISPIFSRINIPETYKIGFSLLLTLIISNLVVGPSYVLTDLALLFEAIKELLIGFMIGFISYLFFSVFFIVGQVIDVQIGFGIASVLDPQTNIQVPITGNFYQLLATLMFLIVDGHHFLIDALVKSYDYVPIGTLTLSPIMVNQFIDIIGKLFVLGLKIGSPVVVSIILVDVLLGILAKTMPQMNVFVVGMPLKVIIGLVLIIMTLPIFFITLRHIFNSMYEEVFNFLKTMPKG